MDSVKRASYDSVEYMLKHMKQREARIAKARKDLNLRPQDELTLIDLPKGGKYKSGTLSYKKMSARAGWLQGEVSSIKSRMAQVGNSALSKAEQKKKLRNLQCQLAYTKTKLSAEVANSPCVVVAAREADC